MRTWPVLCFSLPLLALTIAPRDVEACSPAYCRAWKSVSIAHSTPIPADGVLVLAAEYGEWTAPEETDLAAVYVEVSGEGGELINGTLELSESPLAILWRADEPLMPGLEYDVLVAIDNTIFGEEAYCADDYVGVEGVFETAAPGLPETAAPPIAAEEELSYALDMALENLVCCDGAYPYVEMCGDGQSGWFEGHCATTLQNGRVTLAMTLDADAYAATGGQIGVQGWKPGELTHSYTFGEDGCFGVTAVNFATGEVVAGESICLSPEAVAHFGPQAIDPSEELAGACAGDPYTCDIVDESWSEEACAPWPADGDTDSGTTSDSDSGGSDSTGGETSGATDSGGGTSVTDSGTTTGSGGTSDTDDDSASTTSGIDDGGGCACDVDGGGSPAGLAWLALALPFAMRRRRS
ncbi:MAG: MYXO-CTERM sorting domain-containing protein [Myxococcales bacterium]|nr:MYXO-CTERM sorting domain-containing protein [Myxococcales bacterium]